MRGICKYLCILILLGFNSSRKLSAPPLFLHMMEPGLLCYTNFKVFSIIYSFFIVHIKTWLQDLQEQKVYLCIYFRTACVGEPGCSARIAD